MKVLLIKLYCLLHQIVKRLLGRLTIKQHISLFTTQRDLGVDANDAENAWLTFIRKSIVSDDHNNAGLHYAGYIYEEKSWCLPSWIWTSAAQVKMWCSLGKIEEACQLGELLQNRQQACGGWIVRNDYDQYGNAVPVLAPNDSAYIANNAFVELYKTTGNVAFLETAERCAQWIMETARPDGMVYVGFDINKNNWQKGHNIVDVGFTAALFARLLEETGKLEYKSFLIQFVNKYIELYFIPRRHGFATSLDKNDKQLGGMFARGQAWALEGLIPAYRVLKDDHIRVVISETIETLLSEQHKDGSWAYNLTRPLMGNDCKAVSVIAKNMMEWYAMKQDSRITESARRALQWCRQHTAKTGEGKGGIYSFCMEGAIVQQLYTSTAFVYASSYAIELKHQIEKV